MSTTAWRVLVAVVVAAVPMTGCSKKPSAAREEARSRFDAVLQDTSKKRPIAELCDARPDASVAPEFEYPPLAAQDGEPSPRGTWRWVNVWATWCKPCLEELPLLADWPSRLAREKLPVSMEYLSVDAHDQDLTAFVQSHPQVAGTRRVASPSELGAFLKRVGLDEHATIPVHIWVSPQGRVRCVRSGSVGADDYELVRRVFTEG
jgi:thiol-disulfide isomerase/thioredoxin